MFALRMVSCSVFQGGGGTGVINQSADPTVLIQMESVMHQVNVSVVLVTMVRTVRTASSLLDVFMEAATKQMNATVRMDGRENCATSQSVNWDVTLYMDIAINLMENVCVILVGVVATVLTA